MKGFPANPEGPRGQWYQRVNEAIAAISIGTRKERLLEHLGEPDTIRPGGDTPSGALQSLMESFGGGPTAIRYGNPDRVSEVLVYNDPYRLRSAAFGLTGGVVQEKWLEDRGTSSVPNASQTPHG